MFGLHEAQIIGIVVLLVTIPLMIMRTRWGKPEVKLPVVESVPAEPAPEVTEEKDTPESEDQTDNTPENKD